MEANGVVWESDGHPVVHIAPNNGAEQLLKQGVIESELAASGLEALGVVIDANGDARRRWSQVRDRCRNEFDIPSIPPMTPGGIAGPSSFFGFSATVASVVISNPAIDAAFCSAARTTFVGSRIPIFTMSPYSSVWALKP